MRKSILTAAALLAAAASAQAQTSPTVGWTVTGTVTPAPCNITLSGNGVADFGATPAAVIKDWAEQVGPARYSGLEAKVFKTVNLSVVCAQPSRFALAIADNRAATVSGPAGQMHSFGLGVYTPPGGAATNIGRYVVRSDQLKIVTATNPMPTLPARVLQTAGVATATSNWTGTPAAELPYLPSGRSVGFALHELMGSPSPLLQVAGPLEFALEPLKDVVDAATTNIPFDGSATITLISL